MRRTILPLCTALALLLVAVGGASAADAAGTNAPPLADDSGDDVGVCVVGADSPCNGPAAENATANATHPTPHNETTDATHPTPHDDSTIVDDGTDADDDSDDAGICLVGADSPCNGGESATDGERIGDDDGTDGQMRIPEDQDGDGEIDERFRGDSPAGALIATALSLLGLV